MNFPTPERHILITFSIIFVIGVIVFAHVLFYFATQEMRSFLEANIREHEHALFELAELIDRNAADPRIADIIADCTRRQEYEGLLSTLPSLSKKDLLTLQMLSEGCGSFYAEQKALMTLLFKSSFETYDAFVQMHRILDESSPHVRTSQLINEILSIEQNRSDMLREQALLQDKIITALISGSSIKSKDVQALVEEAQSIQELLGVYDVRADTLRGEHR